MTKFKEVTVMNKNSNNNSPNPKSITGEKYNDCEKGVNPKPSTPKPPHPRKK